MCRCEPPPVCQPNLGRAVLPQLILRRALRPSQPLNPHWEPPLPSVPNLGRAVLPQLILRRPLQSVLPLSPRSGPLTLSLLNPPPLLPSTLRVGLLPPAGNSRRPHLGRPVTSGAATPRLSALPPRPCGAKPANSSAPVRPRQDREMIKIVNII